MTSVMTIVVSILPLHSVLEPPLDTRQLTSTTFAKTLVGASRCSNWLRIGTPPQSSDASNLDWPQDHGPNGPALDGANQTWCLRTKNQIPIHEHIQGNQYSTQNLTNKKFSLPNIPQKKLDHKNKKTTWAHLPHINVPLFYLPPALPSPLSSTSASNK